MIYRIIVLLFSAALALQAQTLIAPEAAMKLAFGEAAVVVKNSRMLTTAQAQAVAAQAKSDPGSKVFRIYEAEIGGKPAGIGVLLSKKVRTKNAAVLYMIDPAGSLKGIEIVAFNEPSEYIPRAEYLEHFEGKSAADTLRVGDDVPMLSGATLSARALTDGARLALALHAVLYKAQP